MRSNEHKRWFDTSLPERLTDVFGLRTEPKDVAIDGTMTGVLSGKRWTGELGLQSFGVDLLEN